MNQCAAAPVGGDGAQSSPGASACVKSREAHTRQIFTGEQVRELLLTAVGKGHGAMKRWAYANNVPHQSVRAACCGFQKPSQAMAAALGVQMLRGNN